MRFVARPPVFNPHRRHPAPGRPGPSAATLGPQRNAWALAVLASACFWVISGVQSLLVGEDALAGDNAYGLVTAQAPEIWWLSGLSAALLLLVAGWRMLCLTLGRLLSLAPNAPKAELGTTWKEQPVPETADLPHQSQVPEQA